MLKKLLILLVSTLCISAMSQAYDFKPGISAAIGVISSSREITPDNPDSDKCENCNGTGKLGDGTIEVTCPVCDGTGKKTKTQKILGNIWYTNPAMAEAVAFQENKPLLIYNYSPNCGPCLQFEEWQPQIFMNQFILLKIDASKSNPYNIRLTPTHIVKTSTKQEIGRWVGVGTLKSPSDYQNVLALWYARASK